LGAVLPQLSQSGFNLSDFPLSQLALVRERTNRQRPSFAIVVDSFLNRLGAFKANREFIYRIVRKSKHEDMFVVAGNVPIIAAELMNQKFERRAHINVMRQPDSRFMRVVHTHVPAHSD